MLKVTFAPKIENAQKWPEFYECDFIEPGLVSYEDVNAGVNMLRKEAIIRMNNTMMGKPVIIDHKSITPKNMNRHAVGNVTKVWYDDFQNKAKCQFIVTEDEGHKLIENGYSVSCAYNVKAVGPGGEWHAIKYDGEILDGEYEHLALVSNPRYEDCKISKINVMMNSKPAKIFEKLEEDRDGLMADKKENLKLKVQEGQLINFEGKLAVVLEVLPGDKALVSWQKDGREETVSLTDWNMRLIAEKKKNALCSQCGGPVRKGDDGKVYCPGCDKENSKSKTFKATVR